MKSVMTKNFSRIPAPQIQRSVFNRSYAHKTTFDPGYLIPFHVDEILPGDTVSLKANIFARVATLIYPILDNMFLDTFFFFIPNRLLWENWERFQGAQDNPDDSIEFEVPELTDDPFIFAVGSIFDYFGLPTGVDFTTTDAPMALPLRAYNLTYNTWFRDQNLQNSVAVNIDDGPDDADDYTLLRRGKRHDYFTSCLPEPQRGDSVPLVLGTSAPVIGNGNNLGFTDGTNQSGLLFSDATGFNGFLQILNTNQGDPVGSSPAGAAPSGALNIGLSQVAANSGVIADLSNATAATINQLREAFATQQILENDARGGTRYVEQLRSHWGVVSPDFRLQRPEYLGGGSQRIDVRAVPQTAPTPASPTVNDVQAGLAAQGHVGSLSGFNRSFTEHGIIIGLVNVRADITYQGGMRRMWSRRTRYDFYMPELAHLGEQAVLNKEIFFTDNNPTVNNTVFGYQERWADYRYFPSLVTGLFRSDASGDLDFWHLSIDYATVPLLNGSWIQDDPPVSRVVAVPNQPIMLMDSYIEIRHARPMPVYSVPGLKRL